MSVTEAVSQFQFIHTPGRDRIVGDYDTLITHLGEQADEHKQRGNDELREMALRFAQHAMLDLEKLCGKWEESDKRGLTY